VTALVLWLPVVNTDPFDSSLSDSLDHGTNDLLRHCGRDIHVL